MTNNPITKPPKFTLFCVLFIHQYEWHSLCGLFIVQVDSPPKMFGSHWLPSSAGMHLHFPAPPPVLPFSFYGQRSNLRKVLHDHLNILFTNTTKVHLLDQGIVSIKQRGRFDQSKLCNNSLLLQLFAMYYTAKKKGWKRCCCIFKAETHLDSRGRLTKDRLLPKR